MGTVVFPDAELKLFLTGNIDIRAQRRYDQIKRRIKPARKRKLSAIIAKRIVNN
jgi:cytidylate kinase